MRPQQNLPVLKTFVDEEGIQKEINSARADTVITTANIDLNSMLDGEDAVWKNPEGEWISVRKIDGRLYEQAFEDTKIIYKEVT